MAIYKTHIENGGGIQVPEIIVVHSLAEYIGDQHAVPFLVDDGTSAHSLVDPLGVNYRCREDNEIAYHAKKFNTNSLGIEALVRGKHNYATFVEAIKSDYVTSLQYEEILRQIREWLNLWPIRKIVRHSDLSPGRKVDPGAGFPWQQLLNDIGKI